MRTLGEIGSLLSVEAELHDVLHRILLGTVEAIPAADAGSLHVQDPNSDAEALTVADSTGFGPRSTNRALGPNPSIAGEAFKSGHSMIYTTPAVVGGESGAGARPHAAMVAPLRYRCQTLGALVVDELGGRGTFDATDLQMLEGLAGMAAVAIVNARLHEAERDHRVRLEAVNAEVARDRDELDRRVRAQETLLELARHDLDLDELAKGLAHVCAGTAMVLDGLGRVRAAHPLVDEKQHVAELGLLEPSEARQTLRRATRGGGHERVLTPEGRNLLIAAVRGRATMLGFLLVDTADRLADTADAAALDVATVLAATALLAERAHGEHDSRHVADVLDLLLMGSPQAGLPAPRALEPPLVLATGIVATLAHRRSVRDPTELRELRTLTQAAIGHLPIPGVVTIRGANLVVAASLSSVSEERLSQLLREVAEEFDWQSRACSATFAMSHRIEDLTALPNAFDEGRLALEIRSQSLAADPVFAVPDLGAYWLIIRASKGRDIVDMCTRVLGPVSRHDARHGGKLLPTFRAYLAAGGSASRAARDLALHVHTVQYRLQKLEELAGLRLNRSQDRLTLELALRVLDVLDLDGLPEHD